MTENTFDLDRAIAEGIRAEALVNDETLQEAFKTLQAQYFDHWKNTPVDGVAAREKLFLAFNIIGKVQDHLHQLISNGRLAKAEISKISN